MIVRVANRRTLLPGRMVQPQKLGGQEGREVLVVLPRNHQLRPGGGVLRPALRQAGEGALVDGQGVVDNEARSYLGHALGEVVVDGVGVVALVLRTKWGVGWLVCG